MSMAFRGVAEKGGAPSTDGSAGLGVEFVWNKGIAALCDRRLPDEFPDGAAYVPSPTLAGALSSAKLPNDLISDAASYRSVREGELIWVRLSWLKSFANQVLPFIESKFVLVTGDSDSCVPSELGAEAEVILRSKKILHWFTQNYDASVPEKVSPFPIGIDFHMLAQGAAWGENISTPAQQERTLKLVRSELPSLGERLPKVYLDFAWQNSWGLRSYRRFHPLRGTAFRESRRRVAGRLRGSEAVFAQEGPLARTEMWRRRGAYAFVASPHGVGLDCHRTWEALALGHIVLVPSSSLDSMYDGLPVVALRSWDEITVDNCQKWLAQFSQAKSFGEKLTNRYWVDKMRSMLRIDSVEGWTRSHEF
jgi:hypothetical protein